MIKILEQIWGIKTLYVDENHISKFSSDEAAIILCITPRNYDRLIRLESLKGIFARANLSLNEYSVQLSQIGIINAIKALQIDINGVLNGLNEIAKNDIIDFAGYSLISEFINSLELDFTKVDSAKAQPFHKNLHTLNEIHQILSEFEFKEVSQRLINAYDSANNSKFKIAVTGVINAGKSSTLNALMNQNILGASNIPETANLSILTYSEDEFAKVCFWSPEELKSMNLEPKEMKDKVVPISELKLYTTAANEISKMVKEVILGIKLDILKDGIDIVDTPGLDDAVVLREILTANYMSQSDFTLHLMNASQSATKKDMAFIVNTLKNGKSGGLIIALTHIDKLSQNDIKEVLNYTKNSIKTELSECGFDESLADETKFFTISAIKNIGIDELRNYLYESFFGSNSKKATLIIDNYKKELLNITQLISDDLKAQKTALTSDTATAKELAKSLQNEIDEISNAANSINSELENLLKRLNYDNENSNATLKSISAKIKDRVISDVKYATDKKIKLDIMRLGVIIESGFNDSFIDFFRDFKQQISKDIDSASKILELKLGAKNANLTLPDIRAYIDEHLPKINYEILNSDVNKAIKNQKNIELLGANLTTIFDDFIINLNLTNKLSTLALSCTNEFITSIKSELNSIQEHLKTKEAQINTIAKSNFDNIKDKERLIANIDSKIAQCQEIKNRIELC
ncbi:MULTISPECIES: dynamin family protein [Campylobacter]|uniref:dynamin family protein n=1 Tax=Campylobacter TaxID=194 RepID=UPI000A334682|nr:MULTISPECIES: dynamin family protein [unclassified Campylobacter]MCR8696835.1 dynamin family protein [Campylobacter sp. RM19073]